MIAVDSCLEIWKFVAFESLLVLLNLEFSKGSKRSVEYLILKEEREVKVDWGCILINCDLTFINFPASIPIDGLSEIQLSGNKTVTKPRREFPCFVYSTKSKSFVISRGLSSSTKASGEFFVI